MRWYEKVSIKSFRNRETLRLFERERSKALPGDVQRVALRKLRKLNQIHYAVGLKTSGCRRVIGWSSWPVLGRGSTVQGSTNGTGCVSSGKTAMPTK
ncbi:hypothetical protein BH20ACT11_BH20ACT11_15270 [soil metagenome]